MDRRPGVSPFRDSRCEDEQAHTCTVEEKRVEPSEAVAGVEQARG